MKSKSSNFTDIPRLVNLAKALSSEDRVKILSLLDFGDYTINQIADTLSIPMSTAGLHVKILEESGLILTRIESASRGTKKVCFKNVDEVTFELVNKQKTLTSNSIYLNMPIGNYSDCSIDGNCGLVNEHSSVGPFDAPVVFYYPNKTTAQLIWFESGYLEYRFPLDLSTYGTIEALEFSFECCSEAPAYKNNWPSDITLSINNLEIYTFTSPGDFGGRKGKLNPLWWPETSSQYGLLYHLKINNTGTFFNETMVNSHNLDTLSLSSQNYLSFKIEVKKDAINSHGINLFGEKFGDYAQNIMLRIDYIN